MKEFYVSGIRLVGRTDVERCEDSEAVMFGVYKRGEDGLSHWVADYPTRLQADRLANIGNQLEARRNAAVAKPASSD